MKKIILLSVMVLCGFMSTYAASVFTVATPLCTADTVHDTIYVTVYDTIYEGVHDTVYRDTVTDTVYTAPEFKSLQVQADVPAQSEADAFGQVSGNGTFPLNSEVEIAAIPNRGCRFMGWGDGNQENPRTVVLDGDRVYVALFDSAAAPARSMPIVGATKDGEVHDTTYIVEHDTVRIPLHDTLWITPHDTLWVDTLEYFPLVVLSGSSEMGKVAGNGTFPVGTVVEIAAVPAEGHRFVHWHDRNRENPRRVTLDDIQIFVAEFAVDTASDPVDPIPPEEPEELWEAVVKYNVQGYDINITCPAHMTVRFFDAAGHLLLVSDPMGDKHTESVRTFRMSQGGLCLVQVGPFPVKKIMLMSATR